jgi:hypothetical protein
MQEESEIPESCQMEIAHDDDENELACTVAASTRQLIKYGQKMS